MVDETRIEAQLIEADYLRKKIYLMSDKVLREKNNKETHLEYRRRIRNTLKSMVEQIDECLGRYGAALYLIERNNTETEKIKAIEYEILKLCRLQGKLTIEAHDAISKNTLEEDSE